MLESNTNQEENIIVKKIEGPSVDDEYNEQSVEDSYDLVNINSYYEEEEPQKSKIKLILPLLAILVGGGAFYLIENNSKLDKNEVVATSSMKERETKVSETIPVKNIIEEKVVTQKEEKKPSAIAKKSEPKVEKEVSTQYIEALAMPTVVEKEEKIVKTVTEPKIEKIVPKKLEEKKVVTVVTKPKVKKIIPKKVIHKKTKTKRAFVKKKKPTLVAHYEKIKPRIIHVRKGDSLALLAKRFYGNEREYKRIVRANRRIKSIKSALHLGEKLIIPRKDNKRTRRYIIVEKGNTLAMIAKKFYGDEKAVSKIVRANRKIKSSRSLLHLGQKVYVPR